MENNPKAIKRRETIYATIILIVVIFLMILCIASFIYAVYTFSHGENINNNIFELIYMAFHFIVLFLAAYFALQARKNGLMFTKRIIYDEHGYLSKVAFVVACVLTFIGFAVFVYFTLAFFIKDIPSFNFPVTLILDLINTPLTIFLIGLFFVLHPFVFKIERKKAK